MNVPDGAKFIFFVVPVFLVTAILILFFFSNNDSAIADNDESDELEEIFGSESNLDFGELKIETTQEGDGREAESGDEVSVHYTGTLKDGTEFDSSYKRGEPYTFVLGIGQVIQGWDQGIVGMKVGEKRRLEIPSSLGYGAEGSGSIPGGAGLIFETELVAIN
jgi:FKBP-type peptidyl-prolyl cis-trans isomerase